MRNTKALVKKTFHYIKYLRKSTEEIDSRSIGNQEEVLDAVIEDIISHDAYNDYVDAGTFKDENYSGTDSERPDFKKVLQLIGQGKINMILVTDLSRLSRNIAESINYIQSVFVMFDVRFVSQQLPALDSYLNPDKIYSLEVPIQSMMNENHCAETSLKVHRTFNRLREDGKFIGAFAGFGWIKSPDDKHVLLLDEEASEIMHLMKDLLFEHKSCGEIARELNEKGIPSPAGYKKLKGLKHNSINKNITNVYLWASTTVKKLLSRPENVGTLIQGRQKVKSYKIHTKIKTSEDEWFVCPNGCPAIFTKEEQDKIDKLLALRFHGIEQEKTDTNSKKSKREPYLFAGFLRCPDCNRAMNKKIRGKYAYYICGTYKNYKQCSSHSIREEKLEMIVLAAIKQQVDVAVNMSELIKSINEAPTIKKKNFDYESQMNNLKKELYKITHYKRDLYQDYKDKLITKDEYIEMKKEYASQEIKISDSIKCVEEELASMQDVVEKKDSYFEHFIKYKGIEKLNRSILTDLIEVIYVYENQDIKIKFTFEDEYKNLISYLEDGKNLLEKK